MFSGVGSRLISGLTLKLRHTSNRSGSRAFTASHARFLRDGGYWGMSPLLGADKSASTTDKSVRMTDKIIPTTDKIIPTTDKIIPTTDKIIPTTDKNLRPVGKTVPAVDNTVRPADFLTEQEFTAYTRLFSDMDKNKDGAISKDELKAGLRDFIGYEASESELSESMQVLDKNKDGKVDINDFLQHMQARKSETRLEAIRFTFEMWDSDSDGFIDKNDLKSMLRAVGEEPSDEKINKILNTSDLDKDGKLSFQEFKDIFKDKQF